MCFVLSLIVCSLFMKLLHQYYCLINFNIHCLIDCDRSMCLGKQGVCINNCIDQEVHLT